MPPIFFREDNRLRVQDNNLKLAEVIAVNVKYSISVLLQSTRLVMDTASTYGGSNLAKNIFTTEKNYLYIARFDSDLEHPRDELINQKFLDSHDLKPDVFQRVIREETNRLERSFSGSTVILNASPEFHLPVVAISFLNKIEQGHKSIIVFFISMDLFIDAFQTSGLSETYMVNNDGDIVAHPDHTAILTVRNVRKSPIVDQMIRSMVDGGQTRYLENNEYHLGSYYRLPTLGLGIISTAPEKVVFSEVYNIQRRNIYLTIVVLNLAVLIVYLYASMLSRPLLRLAMAARMIEKGNLSVQLPPTSRDEIGLLTHSFNSMTEGLKQRENLKSTFARFVNEDVVEMSMTGELSLGGERRDCTILFTDIRNFTPMSERLSPEEMLEFLNGYFSLMVGCVKQTGGTVDKFIGDAIMAIWGAPRNHEDSPGAAVEAALLMREALIYLNEGYTDQGIPPLHIGAGINFGPVIAGQIGSLERLEYTVIGDSVNLASRVESLCKQFGVDILITEHVYEMVKHRFACLRLDKITVKGKTKSVVIYVVLGRIGDSNNPRNVKELQKLLGMKPS